MRLILKRLMCPSLLIPQAEAEYTKEIGYSSNGKSRGSASGEARPTRMRKKPQYERTTYHDPIRKLVIFFFMAYTLFFCILPSLCKC